MSLYSVAKKSTTTTTPITGIFVWCDWQKKNQKKKEINMNANKIGSEGKILQQNMPNIPIKSNYSNNDNNDNIAHRLKIVNQLHV